MYKKIFFRENKCVCADSILVRFYKVVTTSSLLLFLFFAAACEDDETRNPTEIVDNYMNEYRELLTSSEKGWRFDYFPNERQYGGFTFMMKFNQDGRVEMQCDKHLFYYSKDESSKDESKPYGTQISDYTIQNSQGPVLTFATYSLLSKLADPELNEDGSGWQADNEFVLMGQSVNGDTIYLKSVKAQRFCYFVKNDTDWNDYFSAVNGVIERFTQENVANSYFRDIVIAGKEPAVMTGFNLDSRMGVIYQYRNQVMHADSCYFFFTPDGVELKRPINICGVNVKQFKDNGDDKFLINGDASSTISVAVDGRPQMKFSVRDKAFTGVSWVEVDGTKVQESDFYLLSAIPKSCDKLWGDLFPLFNDYLYTILMPDGKNNYYCDIYDRRLAADGQLVVAFCRCPFTHKWSDVEDEISFLGADTDGIYFLAEDTETGDYEQDTPVALEYQKSIKTYYTDYMNELFGTVSPIECVVVPSPDGKTITFVNKKNGEFIEILKN